MHARRSSTPLGVIVALLVLVSACVGSSPAGQELKGKGERRDPNREFLNGTVAANNAFGIDLYRVASSTRGNFAHSPLAILDGLAMARAGSAGDTRAQFDAALHTNLTPDLDSGLNTVAARVSDLQGEKRSDTRKGRISIDLAASLWGQRGTHIKDELLERLSTNYGVGFRVTDFRSDPEASRQAINRWAADATRDKIGELVPRGTVTSFTKFIIASVSYLQAPWLHPFLPELTRAERFERLDGQSSDVRMMQVAAEDGLRYAEGNEWQAVELPYLGDELALLVIMPGPGEFTPFEQSLTTVRLDDITAALQLRALDVHLPQFQFTTGGSLRDQLAAQGLPNIFSRETDFSGITTDEVVSVSDDVYQGFFGVSEEGTDPQNTATAQTAAGSLAGARKVVFDRPFLFFVRDRETGLVLIQGRVVAP